MMVADSFESNCSDRSEKRKLKITSSVMLVLGLTAIIIQAIALSLYAAKLARAQFKHVVNGDFEVANIGSGVVYIITAALGFSIAFKSSRVLRTSSYTLSIISLIAGVICTITSVTQMMGVSLVIDSLEEDCSNITELDCNFEQLTVWYIFESTLLAVNVTAIVITAAHIRVMSAALKSTTQTRSYMGSQVIFNINITNHRTDDPPPPYPSDELPSYEQYNSA